MVVPFIYIDRTKVYSTKGTVGTNRRTVYSTKSTALINRRTVYSTGGHLHQRLLRHEGPEHLPQLCEAAVQLAGVRQLGHAAGHLQLSCGGRDQRRVAEVLSQVLNLGIGELQQLGDHHDWSPL